jgi:hypothetical protein
VPPVPAYCTTICTGSASNFNDAYECTVLQAHNELHDACPAQLCEVPALRLRGAVFRPKRHHSREESQWQDFASSPLVTFSSQRLRRDVGTRRVHTSYAAMTAGSSRSAPEPVKADTGNTGAPANSGTCCFSLRCSMSTTCNCSSRMFNMKGIAVCVTHPNLGF